MKGKKIILLSIIGIILVFSLGILIFYFNFFRPNKHQLNAYH